MRRRDALKNSYDIQQSALLGIWVTTLGDRPLKNPFNPSLAHIIWNACYIPLQCLISGSADVPLVCNSVFATSKGVVNPAATPPPTPPATMCEAGEYVLVGFMIFLTRSYTLN